VYSVYFKTDYYAMAHNFVLKKEFRNKGIKAGGVKREYKFRRVKLT